MQHDEMDEATLGFSECSLHDSVRDTPATLEADANPSLAQAEVSEGGSNPPPLSSDVRGEANPSTPEVHASTAEKQVIHWGEEIPPVLGGVNSNPASPTRMVSDPRGHPATVPPSAANSGAPKSPTRASVVPEAELAERRQAMATALSSSTLLPSQRAILDAALGQFLSVEAGIVEAFLSLAKCLEVCHLPFLLYFRLVPRMKICPVALVVDDNIVRGCPRNKQLQ